VREIQKLVNLDYRRFHSYAIIQMTTINKFEFEFCVTLRS